MVSSTDFVRASERTTAIATTAIGILNHQRHLTPSCGGFTPTAERTVGPAGTIMESLTPRPGIREQNRRKAAVQCRELRLAAGAAMINDQLSGHSPGNIRTQILFDHSQCEVDARSHPSRGPHRAVDDENAILLHLHFWKPSLQFSRAVPMRRRTTAVQQTCFGQHERAGACRRLSCSSLHRRFLDLTATASCHCRLAVRRRH
jgi:hypothetical protein